MNQADRKTQSDKRRCKFAEAMQFSEERIELLDTVRQMIGIELERCGVKPAGNPLPENPPPEGKGREPPDCHRRPTLWQRVMSLFSNCL